MDTSTICGLVITSILLLAFGWVTLAVWGKGRWNGAVVQGRVIGNDFGRGTDTAMPAYAPIVRFTWQDREYTLRPRAATALAPRVVGTRLKVVVPPSGPRQARIDNIALLVPGVAFILFGIAFLAIAVLQVLPAGNR
jgi:hypothetical protein